MIGEAVKQLSPELQEQYPDAPWRCIAGFRDILVRDYLINDHMGIDLDEVWNAVESDLPQLRETVEAMREEIGDDSPEGDSPQDNSP